MIIVNDTFTGSSGQLIAAHTGEIGATWTREYTFSDVNWEMNGTGKLRRKDAAGSAINSYIHPSGIPTTSKYTVEVAIIVASLAHLFEAQILARGHTHLDTFSATVQDGIAAILSYNGSDVTELFVAGRWEDEWEELTIPALSIGTHILKLAVDGMAAEVFWNGASCGTVTVSVPIAGSFTTPGYAGLALNSGSLTSVSDVMFDYFRVEEIVLAPPIPNPDVQFDDTFDGTETIATHVPNIGGPWEVALPEGYGTAASDLVVSGGNVAISASAPSSPYYYMNFPQRPPMGWAFAMDMDVKALNINHGSGPAYARLVIDTYPAGSTFIQFTMVPIWSGISGPPVIPAGVSVFWNVVDSAGNQYMPTNAQAVTANTFYNLRFVVAADRMSVEFYLNDELITNAILVAPLVFPLTIQRWGASLEDGFKDRLTLSRVRMTSYGISDFWTDFIKTTELAS
jgi:hypothetical protein